LLVLAPISGKLDASAVIYDFAYISADQRFETYFLFLETKQKTCFTGSALFLCNQFKIKRSQARYWDPIYEI
jgi:hypothetical protein